MTAPLHVRLGGNPAALRIHRIAVRARRLARVRDRAAAKAALAPLQPRADFDDPDIRRLMTGGRAA